MSVASSSVANPARSKALMVRLAPYLVEAICELTRALKDKTHAQTEISGLLFGKSQEGMLTIEALKTFKDSSGPRSELARRERMEKSFTAAMALANEDPEFAQYTLLGWFSLRGGGGLINSDTEFHNRHFKNSEDVALIVWRDGDTQLTTELYAPIESGKLSTEDYRWSSVRLSTELRQVSSPVDLVMRVRMNDDLYLRTYGVSSPNDRKEEWKKLAQNAKRTILSLLPGKGADADVKYPEDLEPPDRPLAPAPPPPPSPPPSAAPKRAFESRTLFREAEPEAKEKEIEEEDLPLAAKVAPSPAAAPAAPVAAPPPPAPMAVPPPPAAAATPASRVAPMFASGSAIFKQPSKKSIPLDEDDFLPHLNRAPRPKAAPPEISGVPMVIPKYKPEVQGTPWLSMGLVFVLCSGLTFAVMAMKSVGNGDSKFSQVMRVLFPGTDLELHAESRGESLVLSWNRRNPTVLSSTGAVLAVSDGPKHFEKKLDPDMVAEGVVAYKPITGDVTFQLTVNGTDQSTAFGKLRVLDATNPGDEVKPVLDLSSPSGTTSSSANLPPPPSMPALSGTDKPSTPVYTPPLASPAPKTESKPVTESRKYTPPPTTPAVQQQQQPAQSAVSEHPPALATPPVTNTKPAATAPRPAGNAGAVTSNTSISGWDPNLPENKQVAAPPAQQQAPQTTAQPDAKTMDFVRPRVLLQVMPSTRNLTPGVVSERTRVEVEVRIDTKGRVESARLLTPNVKNQLGSAALAAAKQWTFQPATLRGLNVESTHTIVFDFSPEGQQ